MLKSAEVLVTVAEVVLELLAGVGSVTPVGGVTLAVLDRVLPLLAVTVPLMVKVTLPPEGSVVMLLLTAEPLTLTVPHTAPPVGLPQLAVMLPMPAGSVSAKLAPSAAAGPPLLTSTL